MPQNTFDSYCLIFSRLQQLCRLTQLLQKCRKQTRNQFTFCVVNCCAVENKLQSPVGQLKTQRGNLLIPNVGKDTKKDAKDVRDSTKEQDEPRDSSTATRRSEKAGGKGFKSEYCVKNNCKILFQF